jgi:hypothetical protein
MLVQLVRSIGLDERRIKVVSLRLGGGPEVEDEGEEVNIEECGDEPLEGAGYASDRIAARGRGKGVDFLAGAGSTEIHGSAVG